MRSLNNGKSHTFHWGHYSNVGVSLICETYFTNHWFLSITWTFFLIAFFQSVFSGILPGQKLLLCHNSMYLLHIMDGF